MTNWSAGNRSVITDQFRMELRADGLFVFETVVLALIGPLALGLQLFFLFLLYRHFSVHHANVRLFMWNLAMSLFFQSVYFVMNATVNLLHLLTPADQFGMTVLDCRLVCLLPSTAVIADICSALGLGVDRFYATVRRKFDDPKGSGALSKTFVFGSWSITALVNLYMLIRYGSDLAKQPVTHYCHVILESVDSGPGDVSTFVLLTIEVIGIGLPIAVLLISRRLYREFGLKNSFNARTQTLQQRFALSNNVNVSLMLLPLDVLRAVAYSQALILYAILVHTNEASTSRGATLSTLATLISAPLICACPLSCMYMDKRLRRAVLDYWTRLRVWYGFRPGTVTPTNANASPPSTSIPNQSKSATAAAATTATIASEPMSSTEMEMRELPSASRATTGEKYREPPVQKSIVADCVVDFKTNPDKAQSIIFRLWERQLQ